jgi:predicted aldo/keto reductase-like oxidoreductase
MQICNDKILFNVTDKEFKERVGFHHNWGLLAENLPRAAECIACGKCEKACTQHLPIIKRLKEFMEIEKE